MKSPPQLEKAVLKSFLHPLIWPNNIKTFNSFDTILNSPQQPINTKLKFPPIQVLSPSNNADVDSSIDDKKIIMFERQIRAKGKKYVDDKATKPTSEEDTKLEL